MACACTRLIFSIYLDSLMYKQNMIMTYILMPPKSTQLNVKMGRKYVKID